MNKYSLEVEEATIDNSVRSKLASYPEDILPLILNLRSLLLQTSAELNLGEVTESLKWGELSYSVSSGSPIRIDWKAKSPNHYYLYFNCQTKLVDTFRQIYAEELTFEGNRALALPISESLPEHAVKHCLSLALRYHKVKHLPLLGA